MKTINQNQHNVAIADEQKRISVRLFGFQRNVVYACIARALHIGILRPMRHCTDIWDRAEVFRCLEFRRSSPNSEEQKYDSNDESFSHYLGGSCKVPCAIRVMTIMATQETKKA